MVYILIATEHATTVMCFIEEITNILTKRKNGRGSQVGRRAGGAQPTCCC
jgi:hypothetical protein